MLLAPLNDLHFGIKADSEFMLDYQELFFKNIFFPILLKNKVKHIIFGGDMFDKRKTINFHTLNRAKRMFFDPAAKHNIKIEAIPGNHDTYFRDSNEITSLEELFYGYNNINIIKKPTVKKYGDKEILLLPWLNSENKKEFMKIVNDTSATILYGHLELAGFPMISENTTKSHGMDVSLFSKFEQVWSGHYHLQSKIGNVQYLGSPMEFSWGDYNTPRGFNLFDTETNKLKFKKNPYKLYDKIYYTDEHLEDAQVIQNMNVSQFDNKFVKLIVMKKTDPDLFESFLDRLYKRNIIKLTILENYYEMSSKIVINDENEKETDTKQLIDQYVDDDISTEMDKTKIKNILNSLYIEAINSEV